MAKFEWDSSIELGIPAIDEQHKALFGWVNELNDSVMRGDGSETVADLIWNLITYVTEHFTAEEQLMLACSYPGLASHRKEHDQFVERLRNIQVEFIDGHRMSEKILDFLVDWLVCHIKGTDQSYSRHMRKLRVEV
ncbi:MAG: bacteriohemerythrin [Geobacteraceae bacterium]|nr:bacteriohemerythrin [Geobacteraceae bacterium]